MRRDDLNSLLLLHEKALEGKIQSYLIKHVHSRNLTEGAFEVLVQKTGDPDPIRKSNFSLKLAIEAQLRAIARKTVKLDRVGKPRLPGTPGAGL